MIKRVLILHIYNEPMMVESFCRYSLDLLGHRDVIPGFIRTQALTVKVVALALPALLDVAYAAAHYKEIARAVRHIQAKDVKDFFWRHRVVIVLAAAALVFSACAVSHLGCMALIKGVEGVALKCQVPRVVYAGYSLMGLGHTAMAAWSMHKRDFVATLRHLFASCTSWTTIATMCTGLYEARWHHMSYGILSLAPGLTGFSSFGTLMVLDSMLYWIKPNKDNFDFSNIFSDNCCAFAVQLVALSCFEAATRWLVEKGREKKSSFLPWLFV